MSLFKSSADVFEERDKLQHVWSTVRRIIDCNTPESWHVDVSGRTSERYNRTIPMLIVPWEDDEPVIERGLFTVTKDLSDNGISVLASEPHDEAQIVCGFWVDAPMFFSADIRQCMELGGGFWQMGVKLHEVVHLGQYPRLNSLAEKLAPASINLVC